jgi:hypothetical protein
MTLIRAGNLSQKLTAPERRGNLKLPSLSIIEGGGK